MVTPRVALLTAWVIAVGLLGVHGILHRTEAFPALFGVAPLLLVLLGVLLRSFAVVWFAIGAFSMASVMLIFSVGLYYLPVAIALVLFTVWYQVSRSRR